MLLTEEELAAAPEGFVTLDAMGKDVKGLKYRMQLSAMDCMGCGNCADICPAKDSALVMKPYAQVVKEAKNWAYGIKLPQKKDKFNR